jgi:hypothetical protein
MKKLAFDALEDQGEVDDLELTLNGGTYMVSKPTSGQIAIMFAAFAEDVPAPEAAKAIIDFYKNISIPEYEEYDEDDMPVEHSKLPTAADAVKEVLRNPRIKDSLEQMITLTEKVIEAFTGNPTKRPTDYLPSQKRTGQNSTATRRAPASTRSTSPRAASATGSTRSSSRG